MKQLVLVMLVTGCVQKGEAVETWCNGTEKQLAGLATHVARAKAANGEVACTVLAGYAQGVGDGRAPFDKGNALLLEVGHIAIGSMVLCNPDEAAERATKIEQWWSRVKATATVACPSIAIP